MKSQKANVWKWIGLGLGIPVAATAILLTGTLIYVGSGPEGGVRVANNMENYALEYIKENKLLEPNEKVIAYYDATVTLNGSESTILTNNRIIYHKDNKNTTLPLSQVARIKHEEKSMTGDVIQVFSKSGDIMVIEIAPFNNGKLFLNALENQVSQISQL